MYNIIKVLNWLNKRPVFVLLETTKVDCENQQTYIFWDLKDVVQSYNPAATKKSFAKLQSYLDKGYYAAGFCSYEMGYGFEESFKRKRNYIFPLLWMGIFRKPLIFDHRKDFFINNINNKKLPFDSAKKEIKDNYHIRNLHLNVKRDSYLDSIKKIKGSIRAGDTYQVNFTMKYKFNFTGSPCRLYYDLRNNQSVSYCAFIKTGDFKILSFSPELFFRKKGRQIEVKPMKGTMPRGSDLKGDALNRNRLKYDRKNNAENIMIVDLLRNDLGKLSETGSVKVPRIFSVERYETLFQLTSTIRSTLKKGVSLYELFQAIFPSGSVTGAPKIRTMQIINDIEKEERKVYTGSIGFISPNKDATFNVAIRSVLLEDKKGEMGVGSGIVYGSDTFGEYEECKLKANFLTGIRKEFQLIETMLWSKRTGFFLLNLHLERLRESALYFGFRYNEKLVKSLLGRKKKLFDSRCRYRIRLLLFKNGNVSISHRKTERKINSKINLVTISNRRTLSDDIFLRYKTTNRKLYDQEYKKYKRLGYLDTVFQNEKGEITEGAISNIFIKSDGIYYTPPLSSGLLNGVYRRYFFGKNPKLIREKVLTVDDLKTAGRIFLANSLRGMVRVRLDSK